MDVELDSLNLATYESSMIGENLTTSQVDSNGQQIDKIYYEDTSAKPPQGSKMMLQDDPNQEEMQKKPVRHADVLREFIPTRKEIK